MTRSKLSSKVLLLVGGIAPGGKGSPVIWPSWGSTRSLRWLLRPASEPALRDLPRVSGQIAGPFPTRAGL
jgi:hypothetical protein